MAAVDDVLIALIGQQYLQAARSFYRETWGFNRMYKLEEIGPVHWRNVLAFIDTGPASRSRHGVL